MGELFSVSAVWLVVLAILLVAGLWLFITGLRNLLRGRLLRGPLRAAIGAALGGIAIAAAGLGLNLYTYSVFNYEAPVATVEFRRLAPQRFEARIDTGNDERTVEVHGDEWQLDARVLKWQGLGVTLGLKPVYRLERFSGRYVRVLDEQQARRSVYGLGDGEPGLDVWRAARKVEQWLPLVDTVYGSAAYLPMADGARYQVKITEDALIARPDNAEAARAVRNW